MKMEAILRRERLPVGGDESSERGMQTRLSQSNFIIVLSIINRLYQAPPLSSLYS